MVPQGTAATSLEASVIAGYNTKLAQRATALTANHTDVRSIYLPALTRCIDSVLNCCRRRHGCGTLTLRSASYSTTLPRTVSSTTRRTATPATSGATTTTPRAPRRSSGHRTSPRSSVTRSGESNLYCPTSIKGIDTVIAYAACSTCRPSLIKQRLEL